jgi:DNA repair exonuclease SbcCD ATPase subunit
MQVKDIRSRLELAKGQRQHIQQSLAAEKVALLQQTAQYGYCTTAQLILQESARLTQEHLQYRISTLVTLAMESVFDDPYHLDIVFENARGKTQAAIRFLRGEEAVDPLDASGGGAVDVASFGLQVSLWTLQTPRTRNLLVLDEPLKWLKGGGLPDKGASMLQQISHRLGIQIIMVSHSPELIEHADKVFCVEKKRSISSVKELKGV